MPFTKTTCLPKVASTIFIWVIFHPNGLLLGIIMYDQYLAHLQLSEATEKSCRELDGVRK